MPDFLKDFLRDTALLTAVGGIIALVLKRWLASAIDNRYKIELDHAKAELDIYKERLKALEAKRSFVYPEILELVYRLRNHLRDALEDGDKTASGDKKIFMHTWFPMEFGGELSRLVENLYTYRAYIDEPTFVDLHMFKRRIQDANVIFNGLSRPPDEQESESLKPEEITACRLESFSQCRPKLTEIHVEIDRLYQEITKKIHCFVAPNLRNGG